MIPRVFDDSNPNVHGNLPPDPTAIHVPFFERKGWVEVAGEACGSYLNLSEQNNGLLASVEAAVKVNDELSRTIETGNLKELVKFLEDNPDIYVSGGLTRQRPVLPKGRREISKVFTLAA